MTDAVKTLDALLQSSAAGAQLFPPTSRYYGLDTTALTSADGRTIKYLRRRFVPQASRFATIKEHVVADNDRLDNLSARYIGDAELYWRLCDANNAIRPDELIETIGRTLRITLPEGVPAPKGVR
ncbi:LysM domain-containing protein [Bradyrhizobium guangdongense]|uniref:LysM domain-containing protein n=1 Tax=Bradyrhizobium guangdongense TaxID=1325090 RepID=UPI00164339E2|nr:LysM domain-containing protein [Bradyrhizobium guangdongense]